MIWLHRRLATVVEWTLAVLLAALGEGGYAIVGGSQWWFWGQLAVLPLAMLVISRATPRRSLDRSGRGQPWLGGLRDGPWGPP